MINDLSKAVYVTTTVRSLLLLYSMVSLATLLDHPCFQQLDRHVSTLGLLVTDSILLVFCFPISMPRWLNLKRLRIYPCYYFGSIVVCVVLLFSRVVLQLL